MDRQRCRGSGVVHGEHGDVAESDQQLAHLGRVVRHGSPIRGEVFDTLSLAGLPCSSAEPDPAHLRSPANERLDEVRRRVQNETLGHRGRKTDPLYRTRRLLVMADERLDEAARERRRGLLAAGDPKGQVADAWTAKEAVREIYRIGDPDLAAEWVAELADTLDDHVYSPELRRLGRTLKRWGPQIAAWHRSRATNGPVEAVNNLAKRIKRVAFGITNWTHWRVRVLLYAGRPDWSKLATISPAAP